MENINGTLLGAFLLVWMLLWLAIPFILLGINNKAQRQVVLLEQLLERINSNEPVQLGNAPTEPPKKPVVREYMTQQKADKTNKSPWL
jgi:hypothetical protein